MLDRRAAGDPQRRAHLGGDDHGQRGLAEPGRPGQQDVVGGRAAAAGPPPAPARAGRAPAPGRRTRRARLGRRAASTARSSVGLDGDQVDRGRRPSSGSARAGSAGRRPRSALVTPGSACAGPAQRSGYVGGRRPPRRRRRSTASSASLARDQPSPTRRCVHLVAASRGRHGRTTRRQRRSCRPRRADPVLELERRCRWAPLRPMPGTRGQGRQVARWPPPGAASSGAVHREHRLGEPRTDAGDGLHQLEDRALVVVGEAEQGQRVLADDQAGGQRRPARPRAGVARVPGVHWTLEPDPADLDDRRVRADGGDPPRTDAIIGAPARARGRGGRREAARWALAAAPDVADRQGERVGGVGRARGLRPAAAAG